MNSGAAAPLPHSASAIPWRVAPPLISTALLMIGSGFLGSLLPLRFSAMGMSDGVIGLIATAEALGFLAGCLYAHKLIAPVGLERAYATFAGLKSVSILCLFFADSVPALALWRFLIGINAAGLAIIVESWLNALVPNEQRGRVLTIYVLVYGLFFGIGQLFSQHLNVRGPELLFIAGISTTLALVPMVAIEVRAPVLPHRVTAGYSQSAAHLAGERLGLSLEWTHFDRLHHRGAAVQRAHRLRSAAHRAVDGLRIAGRAVPAVADRLLVGQGRPAACAHRFGIGHPRRGRGAGLARAAHAVRTAGTAVRYFRRTRGKLVCGGGGSRQRPRRLVRLRGAVLDPAVRLGVGFDRRTDGRHLRHSTHQSRARFSSMSSH